MIFKRAIQELFQGKETPASASAAAAADNRRRVLNVGGASKTMPIPEYYQDWDHLLLDIDPSGAPDVVCDARELSTLAGGAFDAVYCSHNLEHYFKHDGDRVLKGFMHVLKPDGFADIRVPDVATVIKNAAARELDIHDTLYESPSGPISVHDVIYGLWTEVERSGTDFWAHKTGFTPKSLNEALLDAGFSKIFLSLCVEDFEVRAVAFKIEPSDWQKKVFDL